MGVKNKKFILGNQDVDTSFMALEMVWRGFRDSRIKAQVGMSTPDSFCEIVRGSTINYFVESYSIKSFVKMCTDRIVEDRYFLKELKENTKKIADQIKNFARLYVNKIDSFDDKNLLGLLREIDHLQTECTFYGTAVAFADIYGDVTNRLVEVVQKRKNLNYPISTYTSILAIPEEKSLTQQAEEDIVLGKKSVGKLLEEYFWFNQGYVGMGLTKSDLEKIRNSYTQIQNLVSRDELISELGLDADEQRLFSISQDIIYTKTLRADSRQFLYVVMNRIIDRFFKKLNIEFKYLSVMSVKEFCNVIEGNLTNDNLQGRWSHSIFTVEEDGNYKVLIDDQSVDNFLKEHRQVVLKEKEIVKGQTAFPGKVKGVVKLVFGPQHNSKVKPGDILVSLATSPQLLPAMKIAKAFVTDVGGITSHAAIVARELKIPCIVGTKIATQIFKDGDLIEVDADKGIVKIL